jgi:hypothetical protein
MLDPEESVAGNPMEVDIRTRRICGAISMEACFTVAVRRR